MKSLEKQLFPKSDRLIINKDYAYAQIIDAELDPLDCVFNNDGCVEIDTKKYSYITLSIENLYRLLAFIDDVEQKNFDL